MRKKIKMSTADGDEINLRKVHCQAAIDDSSRTDPKVIWQFFANNADSLARLKMTPTCTVNRKITRLRDVSGDAVEETVVKVSKKRRRTGVTTLLHEESQVRKLCAGQTDILESGAGDCKKKKKKKRVNKSVKRRRALAAKEVLNVTMAGLKNPSGQGQLVELELPTDCTGLGLVSSDESPVTVRGTVTVPGAALTVHRCIDTDADVWSQGNHSLEPDSSKAFFPIDNYRSLQVPIHSFIHSTVLTSLHSSLLCNCFQSFASD